MNSDPPKPKRPVRACFVVVYFGDLPEWIDYYFLSCAANPDFHWRIFTDSDCTRSTPDNVFLHPYDREDLEKDVSAELECDYRFSYGYKLCDLKPVYGVLFADFLDEYEFWGYTDVDLIWGRIHNFVDDDILDRHDILTASTNWVVGHFTLFRNNNQINNLFRLSDNYHESLTSLEFSYFCERNFGRALPTIVGEQRLRLYQEDIQTDDCIIWWSGRPRFLILWHDGILTDLFVGRELAYFHFIQSKRRPQFKIQTPPKGPNYIAISDSGIQPIRPSPWLLRLCTTASWTLIRSIPYYGKMLLKPFFSKNIRTKLRKLTGTNHETPQT